MGLFQEWQSKMEENQRTGTQNDFFQNYIRQEAEAYKQILDNQQKTLNGSLKELSDFYSMDIVTFTGFLDGISTSITGELELENLTEDTILALTIEYEKLYYNMLKAKADWLYTLPQWDNLLDEDKKKEIRMKLHQESHVTVEKIGRNDPCPCGSGKKYKKCCGK